MRWGPIVGWRGRYVVAIGLFVVPLLLGDGGGGNGAGVGGGGDGFGVGGFLLIGPCGG